MPISNEVRWPKTALPNKGQHGGVISCGLSAHRSLYTKEDELIIEPITSKGNVSESLRIVIPFSALPEVARLLNWFAAGPLGRAAIEAEITE